MTCQHPEHRIVERPENMQTWPCKRHSRLTRRGSIYKIRSSSLETPSKCTFNFPSEPLAGPIPFRPILAGGRFSWAVGDQMLEAFRKSKPTVVSIEHWFSAYLDKSSGCWVWVGTKCQRGGYGHVTFRHLGKKFRFRAHRFAWELWKGEVPDGMLVCHKCDNPPCCNPEHLFLGTSLDNYRDAVIKGRQRQRNHVKLKPSQVIQVRNSPQTSARKFAMEFNVSTGAIADIRSGRTWSWLKT